MPVEDQPWYPNWLQAVNRAIATREARDREKLGTPAWEAADGVYQTALAAYRVIAMQIK
jgi:hypothetical protein